MKRIVRLPHQRVRVQAEGGGESLTDQGAYETSDVNRIVAQYARTGVLPPATRQARFEDVTGLQGDLTDKLQWATQTLEKVTQEYKAQQAQKNEQSAQQTINEQTAPETNQTEPQAAQTS